MVAPVSFPAWAVTYYLNEEYLRQDEEEPPPLAIGTGVLWEDGSRYRVVDVWVSYEKRGELGRGTHVFLEPAQAADDRPKRMAPGYYVD